MVRVNTSSKNPLENKKWLKEFSEGLKKDIQKSPKQAKNFPQEWISEIICTQEDIGEPQVQNRKKSKK